MPTTAVQNFNEWAAFGTDKTFEQFLSEQPAAQADTIATTAIQTLMMVGLGGAVRRFQRRDEQASAAEKNAVFLENLDKHFQADKLLARDPETFEQFMGLVAESGPVQHFFIDAKTLLQSGMAEQVASVSPSVASQLQEAVQTGGLISIPIEEYAARIAPTEASRGLIDHLRIDPEGYSRTELKAWRESDEGAEFEAEVERALADKQGDDAFKASQDVVKAAILDEMNLVVQSDLALRKFTPARNETFATLFSTYYAVRAAQTGETPESLYQRRRINFGFGSVGGLNQTEIKTSKHGWHPNRKEIIAERASDEMLSRGESGDFYITPTGKAIANGIGKSFPGTLSATKDGRYLIEYLAPWNPNEQVKSFWVLGDTIDETIDRANSRLNRSYQSIRNARTGKIDKAFRKSLEDEFGKVFDYDISNARGSSSFYITHKPSGIKIRVSDHDLPSYYENTADLDLREDEDVAQALRNELAQREAGGQQYFQSNTLWKTVRSRVLKTLRERYPVGNESKTVHDANGKPVIVSYRGFKHALNSGVPSLEESVLALHIEEVIAKAAEGETVADHSGRDDPISTTHYHAVVTIDGRPFRADLVVRNHHDGSRYYDHAATQMESPAGLPSSEVQSKTEGSPRWPFTGLSLSVSEVLPAYNQSVWHGSPHRDIEQHGFRLVNIGTGEGAQAYGWGIYFAGVRDVAEGYRVQLSQRIGEEPTVRGRSLNYYYEAAEREGARGSQLGYDKAALMERLMMHESPEAVVAHGRDPDSAIDPRAVDWFEKEIVPHFKAGGQLYSAEIPDDHELLDWDKPLSEQPEGVKAKLPEGMADDDMTGGTYYNVLVHTHNYSHKAASEYLNSLGIPGLRYLDGQSRTGGEGSHNYVIWDESRLNQDVRAYYQRPQSEEARQFADTEKAYGGREAFDKAKSKGKTKLNYRQWIQVRMQNFRNWFGDWEALRDLAFTSFSMSKADAGTELAKLNGRDLVNLEQGITAQVNVNQANKLVSNDAVAKSMANGFTREQHYAVASQIESLWKHASQIYEGPDAGGNKDIRIRRFATPFVFNGETRFATLLAKETTEHGRRVYTVELHEIETLQGMLEALANQQAVGGGIPPTRSVEETIRQLSEKVNPDSVSKVIDPETGEPMVMYHGTGADFNIFKAGYTGLMFASPSAYQATEFARNAAFNLYRQQYIQQHPNATDREIIALSNTYIDEHGGTGPGANVMPVFVSARNPFDASGMKWDDAEHPNHIADVKAKGHDALWIREHESNTHANIAVVSPTQIKSAIGNTGAFDPANPDILRQNPNDPLGAFNPDTLTVSLLKGANLSTFLHEAGHFFLEMDIRLAGEIQSKPESERTEGEKQILSDLSSLFNWFGIQGDLSSQMAQWANMGLEEKRSYHERMAESFERYLFSGQAPSIELQPYFQKFRAFLLKVYTSLKNFLDGHPEAGKLNKEVRAVFDRMLATNEQIQLAQQARSMRPFFSTAEKAGMTVEEFSAYQRLDPDASNTAIQELQARALRDALRTRNAHSRAMKALTREAQVMRDELEIDARREVMSQPIYRAWQFLTAKLTPDDKITSPKTSVSKAVDETRDSLFTAIAKLGGLSRDAVQSEWGLDPAEKIEPPIRGKHVLPPKGGRSIDGMAEALSQYGYLPLDEGGKWNIRDLETAFFDELRGNPQYSEAHDYDADQPSRAGDQVANPEGLGAGRLDLGALEEMYGAANPEDFIPAPDGSLDFGEITQEQASVMKRQAGKIRLRQGDEAWGLVHIQQRHGEQIRRLGFNSVEEFVSTVASGFTAIYQRSGGSMDVVLETGRTGQRLVVKLEPSPDGDFYDVKTASPIRPDQFKNQKPLWERTGTSTPTELAGSPSPWGQSDDPTIPNSQGEGNPLSPAPQTVSEPGIGSNSESLPPANVPPRDNLVPPRDNPLSPPGYPPAPPSMGEGVDQHLRVGADAYAYRLGSTAHLVSTMRNRGMTAKTGLHPDLVAELFGFSSGDELVRKIADAEDPQAAIDALVDQRMLEQHGELATPEAIEREADKAIHNDVRARFLAAEANALAKAVGGRRLLLDAAKQYARELIGRTKVRNLRPAQFTSAETRAGRMAEKAFKAGDTATAAAEKRNQVIQHVAAKAAYEAQGEVDTGLRYLRRFNRDKYPGIDGGAHEQILGLLSRFGLSNRQAAGKPALQKWIDDQLEAGREIDLSPEMLDETFSLPQRGRKRGRCGPRYE
ncbi:MAG: hypothetical protein LBE33_06185 [Zoogloeaceae bacterium]|jgi:hypothetical protein|nr:hypothetical protein [Zoogloeaceae bacterium]